MSNNPWKVLELDAATATLSDVKRGYARLLKIHRPDRDPEGFMHLRAAYEAVQSVLSGATHTELVPGMEESRLESASAVHRPISVDGMPKTAPDVPTEVKRTLEELRAAASTKVRQKVRIAWAIYEEAAEKHEFSRESRWLLFIEVFAGNVFLLADSCTDERLLDHLKHGEMRLLRIVTDIWSKQGDSKRLDEFCVSLNRQRELVNSETGAMALAITAIALGAWNPEQAARIAQRVFPKLPTSQRSELAEKIDCETILGRLVAPLPQSLKFPWVEVLRHGDLERPWKEIITRDMVIAIFRYCGNQWLGFQVLHQRLKPESWLEFKQFAESLMS